MSGSYVSAIISQLYAGNKLQVLFDTPAEREAFRKRLYDVKARQDKVMAVLLEEKPQVLRFEKFIEEDNGLLGARIWLEAKREITFSFSVIKDASDVADNDDASDTNNG